MPEARALAPALYIVATPIGAARDITLGAIDVLASADILAAEDTRTLRRLMEIHGIARAGRPVLAYHDHNGPAQRPKILAYLEEGRSVAYASDAGTPLVADPGFQLVQAAIEAGHSVHTAPGPSAVLAALTVSGLPTDRFFFAGFPPPSPGARARFLQEIASVPATIVLFEAPKRLSDFINSAVQELGGDRRAAVCRELTKRYETVMRGTLLEIADQVGTMPLKGEAVVVIDRAQKPASEADRDAALLAALQSQTVKDAARDVAEALGLPRREVYQAALQLAKRS